MKRLKEDSELYNRLLQLESLFEELDISLSHYGPVKLKDNKTGLEFTVGHAWDGEGFPRMTDVGFYLIED